MPNTSSIVLTIAWYAERVGGAFDEPGHHRHQGAGDQRAR